MIRDIWVLHRIVSVWIRLTHKKAFYQCITAKFSHIRTYILGALMDCVLLCRQRFLKQNQSLSSCREVNFTFTTTYNICFLCHPLNLTKVAPGIMESSRIYSLGFIHHLKACTARSFSVPAQCFAMLCHLTSKTIPLCSLFIYLNV